MKCITSIAGCLMAVLGMTARARSLHQFSAIEAPNAAAQGELASFDYPGAVATRPFKVSATGVVVGLYIDAGQQVHGFQMSGGTFQDISAPGAIRTNVLGINPRGDIVGRYDSPDNRQHGYLLQHGSLTRIDVPGAVATIAAGISPMGDLVGRYTGTDGVRRGFLLKAQDISRTGDVRQDAVFGTINFPGATLTEPADISPSGDIVGYYRSGDGRFHAFVLSDPFITVDGQVDGAFMSIDVPNSLGTGSGPGGVVGINPQGEVAGWYTALDGTRRGFVWTTGDFQDVIVPEAMLTCAFGINASGWVVGSYVDRAGNEHGFVTRRSL